MKKNRGQSMVEYMILMAAVIVILLVFAKKDGFFQKGLNKTVEMNSNFMLNMANQIFN